ncbi:terminase large subunit [Paracoccus phage ParMal1]|uniref:Terminase large subunit n=1 Tax=Paracoccus phage ParMal1 TaxID=3032416 RepID=A0AAF0FNS5_9CAUD|nr:terminase large subunit [Paracoccus phage ParMal1]
MAKRNEREFGPGERWADLDLLREEYPNFKPFIFDVMTGLLGFECSDIQLDIAEFLEFGPKERMIQAQRGQAKTTITAAYAVWRLIHQPNARILIISAGGTQATEIANWVIQIIDNMDELACLRPDRSAGDRASVEAYDVHYELKGPEKSPSIACVGITSNMQGKRADILIADDIESAKNSQTELMRERLTLLTRDFASICSDGDIIYLGTPQSIDSVYNGLFSRGYTIRIWPGRYPTEDEEQNYGTFLAPLIRRKMEQDPSLRTGGGPTGERGKNVDMVLPGLSEEKLTKKEIDQGAAYFQLQHMLDTRLSDANRFPLKSDKLVFMQVSEMTAPLEIFIQRGPHTLLTTPQGFYTSDAYYRAAEFGREHSSFTGCHMAVDPSGSGSDETTYAVTKFLAGRVFLVDFGAVPGGVDEDALDALTAVAERWKPNHISIEKNFGDGALASVWKPKLLRKHRCEIEDVWAAGQKELRIIDCLEPVIGSGRLIVDESLLAKDVELCERHPLEKRASYSFFYQLSRLTREKQSLKHDDRLDAVAWSVKHWTEALSQDSLKVVNQQRKKAWAERMKNPLGDGTKLPAHTLAKLGIRQSRGAVSRMKRRF